MILVAQQKLSLEALSPEDLLQVLDTLHTYVGLLDQWIDKLYLDEAMLLSDYPQYCVKLLIECYNSLEKAFSSLASKKLRNRSRHWYCILI